MGRENYIDDKQVEESLIEVDNLKKYFIKKSFLYNKKLEVKAVDGVSFSLKSGEILGVVGESGCGKSTTGKTILKLIEPTNGRVIYKGRTIFDIKNNIQVSKKELLSLRKELQFIFQDPYASLNPRMSVEKIISEGIRKHQVVPKGEVREKCKEMLELCGLSLGDLNKFPNEFSGGQRQRIGIARTLALNPKFIICHEPTAALDVSVQSQILNLMLDLKDRFKLTYLFISHNLEVVRYFCDSICVMYLGKIVEKAKSKNLYNTPLHPYSKALISSIPRKHPLEKSNRIQLKGIWQENSNIPTGCRFHPRCPFAEERCKIQEPQLREVEPNHWVACHRV